MKLSALLAAGALAFGTFAAVPAEAQRYGYHRYGGYGYRGYPRRWGPRRGYGYGYGFRGRGYGYRGYGFRGGRVVCRVRRGYYGAVRRCFRVY